MGDIVEVDTILKRGIKKRLTTHGSEGLQPGSEEADDTGGDGDKVVTVRRGRVLVKEVGEQTKKGGYHLTLVRYKHFALFQKKLYSTRPPYITHVQCHVILSQS